MKTLDEIKDELAKEYGHDDFESLLWAMADGEGNAGLKWFEKVLNEVARIYAQQVAEDVRQRCAENAKIKEKYIPVDDPYYGEEIRYVVSKQSILNTEIKLP